MEDNRAEQIEALQVLEEFNGRLVKNMEIIVKELSGERLDDTDQFLKGIVDAINWEMQVLNDGKVRVDKESFNADIVALSKAISAKDDAKMAEEFQRVIPVFKQLGESVNEVIK